MKAAVVSAAGLNPAYLDFREPVAEAGEQLLKVNASAMSHLTKGRASGAHYSAGNKYPLIAGIDGVGTAEDGSKLYFILPRAPFGAMAELCPVQPQFTIPLPAGLDAISAAALANPGMSAWAALVERAHFLAGETVLINGATGVAGRVAVQVARHLGARRILSTGRNAQELEELRTLGADTLVPFSLGTDPAAGASALEGQLRELFQDGIDVVVDYLWGASARAIITAIAKGVEDTRPVRFIQVGTASGQDTLDLPGAALRSSPIQLMGSGLKSVPLPKLLEAIGRVFEIAGTAKLEVPIREAPLAQVGELWDSAAGKPRLVFTMP